MKKQLLFLTSILTAHSLQGYIYYLHNIGDRPLEFRYKEAAANSTEQIRTIAPEEIKEIETSFGRCLSYINIRVPGDIDPNKMAQKNNVCPPNNHFTIQSIYSHREPHATFTKHFIPTEHALMRMDQRSVSNKDIQKTLAHGTKKETEDLRGLACKYKLNDTTVVTERNSKVVRTTYRQRGPMHPNSLLEREEQYAYLFNEPEKFIREPNENTILPRRAKSAARQETLARAKERNRKQNGSLLFDE